MPQKGRQCGVNLVMLGGTTSLKAEVSTLIGLFLALNDSHSFMMDLSFRHDLNSWRSR